MISIFVQLSQIILIVLGVSFLLRIFKQPLIIGYILSGIIIGPIFLNLISANETISIFSEFGIAFLLFIVGLHLSPKVIKEVGKVSLVTGIGQVLFTSLIGYLIGISLGFSSTISIYIAIALTFSSTIIIMKLLSDKDDLEKLYGKISIGFLLVQDFIAIIILMIISSFSGGSDGLNTIFFTFLRGAGLVALMIPATYYVLPKLETFFAKSQEFLFLFSIAWGLGFSALFFYLGFSIEVGALIAGIFLSISPYNHEISSKMKPLRDFFIISFFLLLGSQMIFSSITSLLIPAAIFSLFILIGNPLIVIILMGLLGYSKRTGFMAGLTVAQISEFSLILIALGVKLGHLTNEILSFVTLIGLITIAGSTYMIMYSDKIYPLLSKYLAIFEKKRVKEKMSIIKKPDSILIGYNRIGYSLLKSFSKLKKECLVVDFNPETINIINKKGIPCIYADAGDSEMLEEIKIHDAKLVISTVPSFEDNMLIIKKIRDKNEKSIVVVTARQIDDALEAYDAGADYVIMPHFLGGDYVSHLVEKYEYNKKLYEKEKTKHLKELKDRIFEGHEHPEITRG